MNLKKFIKFANLLDTNGYYQYANIIDDFISKKAQYTEPKHEFNIKITDNGDGIDLNYFYVKRNHITTSFAIIAHGKKVGNKMMCEVIFKNFYARKEARFNFVVENNMHNINFFFKGLIDRTRDFLAKLVFKDFFDSDDEYNDIDLALHKKQKTDLVINHPYR